MENKNLDIGYKISWLIGAVLGLSLLKYIFIPIILLVLSFYIINYIVKEKKKYITTAIAVQTGHLLWILSGIIIFYYQYKKVNDAWIDVLILVVGLFWIYLRPSIASIVFLLLYQIPAIFLNIHSLINFNSTTSNLISLIFHMVLRISAIILMILGYKEFRQDTTIELKSLQDKSLDNSSWLCICGTSNLSADTNCRNCEISRNFVLKNYTSDEIIKNQINVLKKKLRRNKKEYNLKLILNKKVIAIASMLIVVIAIVMGFPEQLGSVYSKCMLKACYNINSQEINIKEAGYDTYLMVAAKHKDIKQIKLLLKCGADVNIRNEYGDSAINFAIRENDIEAIKLLLKNGATVTNTEIKQAKDTNLKIEKLLINYANNISK